MRREWIHRVWQLVRMGTFTLSQMRTVKYVSTSGTHLLAVTFLIRLCMHVCCLSWVQTSTLWGPEKAWLLCRGPLIVLQCLQGDEGNFGGPFRNRRSYIMVGNLGATGKVLAFV